MKKAVCTAVAERNRIQLVIQKGEPGYDEFARVLNTIEGNGYMSWYGDITNAGGEEQCGIIITCKPNWKA